MSVIYNITLDDHFHDVLLLLLLLLLYGTGTLHANSLPFRQSSFFRLAPPAPLLSLFATLTLVGVVASMMPFPSNFAFAAPARATHASAAQTALAMLCPHTRH